MTARMTEGTLGEADKDPITKHVIKQYKLPSISLVPIPYEIATGSNHS